MLDFLKNNIIDMIGEMMLDFLKNNIIDMIAVTIALLSFLTGLVSRKLVKREINELMKNDAIITINGIYINSVSEGHITNEYKIGENKKNWSINDFEKNRNSVYFTYYNDEKCLMINMIKKGYDFIVEHRINTVKISVKNIKPRYLYVVALEILYLDNRKKILITSPTVYEEHFFNCQERDTIDIQVSEVTSELNENKINDSICYIKSDEHIGIAYDENVLDMLIPDNVIAYKKLNFYVQLTDMFSKRYYFDLQLEKMSDTLCSETKSLTKRRFNSIIKRLNKE